MWSVADSIKVLAAHDGTFPALLKTLSDTSDTVVTRDLQLLSQISKNSDDSYFMFFMVNLLKLFCTDRRLLETRGNLIIRQLCLNLSPERIYRTMADCLEKDEVTHLPCLLVTEGLMEQDVEFASIMVQNLNNNLITAPELSELRRKLRNWEIRVRRSELCNDRSVSLNVGWTNVLRGAISVMVSQCRSHDLIMFTCTSL